MLDEKILGALAEGGIGLPVADGYVLTIQGESERVPSDSMDQLIDAGWVELDGEGSCRMTEDGKSCWYLGLL